MVVKVAPLAAHKAEHAVDPERTGKIITGIKVEPVKTCIDIGPSQRRRITAHGGDHFNRRIRHTRRRIVSDALDIILDLTHKQRGPHIGARGGKIDARLRQPGRLRIKSEITDIDVAIGQPAAGIDRKPAIALDIAGHCLLARQRHTP